MSSAAKLMQANYVFVYIFTVTIYLQNTFQYPSNNDSKIVQSTFNVPTKKVK